MAKKVYKTDDKSAIIRENQYPFNPYLGISGSENDSITIEYTTPVILNTFNLSIPLVNDCRIL